MDSLVPLSQLSNPLSLEDSLVNLEKCSTTMLSGSTTLMDRLVVRCLVSPTATLSMSPDVSTVLLGLLLLFNPLNALLVPKGSIRTIRDRPLADSVLKEHSQQTLDPSLSLTVFPSVLMDPSLLLDSFLANSVLATPSTTIHRLEDTRSALLVLTLLPSPSLLDPSLFLNASPNVLLVPTQRLDWNHAILVLSTSSRTEKEAPTVVSARVEKGL